MMLMVMVMIMILVIRLVLWCINHHRYFCCHYDSLCVIKYCFWIVLLLLPCFMMLVAICKDMALVRALMCSPLADTIGLEQHLSTPSILFHTHCLLFGVIFLTSSFIFVAQVGLMVFTSRSSGTFCHNARSASHHFCPCTDLAVAGPGGQYWVNLHRTSYVTSCDPLIRKISISYVNMYII
jgi:hypothetical protein